VASARPLAVSVRLRWALQQRIHVALSLGLPEATLGCDLGDEVVVTFFDGKDLIRRPYSTSRLHFEPISLSTIFLEHNLPGLDSHLRLYGSREGVALVIVSIL